MNTSDIRFRTALQVCLFSFKKELSVSSAKQLCVRIPSKIPDSNKTERLTTVSPILVAQLLCRLSQVFQKECFV